MSEAGAERVERRWGGWRWLVFAGLLVGVIVGAALWRRATDVEAAVEAAGGQVLWENQPNLAQKASARLLGVSDGSAVLLGLRNTEVDDDWLRTHRGGLERIADRLSLHLTNTRVTDVGLGHLRDLKNVNTLFVSKTAITDASLAHLETLPELEELGIDHTGVTGDGLERLSSYPKLWNLGIDRSQATEGGVGHLRHCRSLRWLAVRDATDEAVVPFADFTQLERFFLDGPGVTDASIPVLAGMTQLEAIMLVDDGLSEEGYESLQQALPNCRMTRLTGAEARGE